jgi:hypothetical protein
MKELSLPVKKFICIVFLCLCFASTLPAQEETGESGPAEKVRKVCIFDIPQIQKQDGEPGNEIFTEVIKESLMFELELAGFEIIDDSVWKEIKDKKGYRDEDLLEGSYAVTLARDVKADVAITGFYRLNEGRILFGIKCYDVKSRRLAVSILKDGRAGVSATNLINNAIEEIIPKISEELASYSAQGDTIEKEVVIYEDITFKEMIEMGTTIQVTLQSVDEDAAVYLADTPVGKIKDGQITFDSQASAVVEVRVEKAGYHPRTCEFEVGGKDEVIHLPRLAKRSRLALRTEYTLFQTVGLGIGVRYYFIPDSLFLDGSCYPYIQAGYIPGSNSVLHLNTNLTLGYYVYFSPSSLFRAGVLAGLGWIPTIIMTKGEPVYHDFYWDILGIWVELNFHNFIIYCKENGRFNHNITGDGLLETGWARPIPVVLSIGVIWKW